MPTRSIAQRLAAIKTECPAILQELDQINGSVPEASYAATALRQFATLSDPPPAIGGIKVAYDSRQDLTGLARVEEIRDELDAISDAFADVADDWLTWTQEFDDVIELFLEV